MTTTTTTDVDVLNGKLPWTLLLERKLIDTKIEWVQKIHFENRVDRKFMGIHIHVTIVY